jgi:DNA-binding winged helix-turn-helix (wHTH) protein
MNVRATSNESLVDLAAEPGFSLGRVEITPSLLALRRGERTTSLEPRVMQVLTVLARRPGAVVARDELVATCWAGRFVSEDAIQRTIAKLRRLAETEGGGEFSVETVPRVGYRLVVTSGGDAPAGGARRRWPWALAALALIAAVGAGALAWRTFAPVPTAPTVVRFAGFAGLGPGVPPALPASFSETVRDAFGEDNDLSLSRRGGDFALAGVIQRAGEKLRYSVRLEDIRSGVLVWAVSPELPAGDAAAPQTMATAVAEVVRCGLKGAGEYRRRLPSHTLALYLQYCDAFLGVGGSAERGLAAARRTVAETPDFSRGWSAVAHAAALLNHQAPDIPANALAREVHMATARALRLDPLNGEAYDVQTYILPPDAYEARERLHRMAVRSHLTGCGCELVTMVNFQKSVGRPQDGYPYARRAYDLQPAYQPAIISLAVTYDDLGQWGRAEEIFARNAARRGGRPTVWDAMHAGYRGDWSVFRRFGETADRAMGPAIVAASDALASGDARRLASARAAVEQAARARPGTFALPELLIALGDDEEAFRQLQAVVDHNGTGYLFTTRLKGYRRDPRYAAILERSGLMAYWRKSGRRPVLCTEPDPPAFCATLPRA